MCPGVDKAREGPAWGVGEVVVAVVRMSSSTLNEPGSVEGSEQKTAASDLLNSLTSA